MPVISQEIFFFRKIPECTVTCETWKINCCVASLWCSPKVTQVIDWCNSRYSVSHRVMLGGTCHITNWWQRLGNCDYDPKWIQSYYKVNSVIFCSNLYTKSKLSHLSFEIVSVLIVRLLLPFHNSFHTESVLSPIINKTALSVNSLIYVNLTYGSCSKNTQVLFFF